MAQENEIEVSVLIPTHNHAAFLSQAIESALAQELNAPYEILVGDDCSTDGAREIALKYAADYDLVRAICPEKNEGGHANYHRLLSTARGRYVALLEGDDCWCAPDKLQKQCDFLRDHPECVLCYHPVRIRTEDGDETLSNQGDPARSSLKRLSRFNYLHTPSVMFRGGIVTGRPDWFYDLALGDWPMFMMLAEHGEIGFLPEPMAIYRIHRGGTWGGTPLANRLVGTIRVAEVCRRELGYPGLNDCIYKSSKTLAQVAWKEGRLRLAIRAFAKAAFTAIRHRRDIARPKKRIK